ncbi:MAG: ATP-binding protein [Prevotellaceae bacterium]|nr:ATP-binding protein [Prevotellaceae bacterium]
MPELNLNSKEESSQIKIDQPNAPTEVISSTENSPTTVVQEGPSSEVFDNSNKNPIDIHDKEKPITVVQEGSSSEVVDDPNKIPIDIPDKDTPIIIFFGPRGCGKTMTLVRLSRYLIGKSYKVNPEESFRPNDDTKYKQLCKNFDSMINKSLAAGSTNKIDYLLVKVYDKVGNPLFQILEGPGENYFDPKDPEKQSPAYLNYIINRNNRKIWVVMLEPVSTKYGMVEKDRKGYVDKINNLKKRIKPADKVIFLLNKIDETAFVISPGNVNMRQARKYANDNYPNIFEAFKNSVPILNWFKPYNCDFTVFQTGDYTVLKDGVTQSFQQGDEIYPRKLWNLLLKKIRG